MKKIFLGLLVFFQCSFAQVKVIKNFNLELAEKDSVTSLKIEKSINAFLTEAQNGAYTNKYSEEKHREKFNFFFRKLAGIGKGNKSFQSPLVLKSYPVDDNGNYRVTIGFTGIKNNVPFIYQVTELQLKPYLDYYKFYCTFDDNTKHFKQKTIKNVTYFYSNTLNKKRANKFAKFRSKLSKLTKTKNKPLDYYCFQSLDELLKSYGFLYSARQCNFLCYDLGFSDNKGTVFITGTGNENYLSEYVEDHLYYNLPNKENMYWPFAIGVSTFYGGYGLTYTDTEALKKEFRKKLKKNPDINFLEEFKKGRKSSVNRYFSHYVMSTFLFEKALNEKGFDEALKLVYSGSKGEHFFKNLKEILNIDENNFHKTIVTLINNK